MLGIRRVVLYSAIERYATVAINLVAMAAIARLLSPDQIGIFLVGAAFVIMTETMRDFGIAGYLVQVPALTPDTVPTAFTALLILSALFGTALFALAGPVADAYHDERLAPVLRIAAAAFVFAPVVGPILGLLRRRLAFDKLMFIGTTGALANLVVSVTLAWNGHGYLSLAWGAFASAAATALAALALRPQPGIYGISLREWRSVFRFGWYSTTAALLGTLYQQLPQFVLGRTLGFQAVGLVNRTLMICQLPEKTLISAVQPVILPALSAHARGGGDLERAYLLGLAFITAVYWPFLICLALLADPVVLILLGADWMAVAPLVRIVAVAWLALFPVYLTYPMLVSMGRIKDVLTIGLITLPPSAALFVAASPISIEAVAATTFVTAPLQAFVALRFILRHVRFGWTDIATATRDSLTVAAYTAIAPAIAVAWLGFGLSIPAALAAAAGAGIGWLIGLVVTAHPLLREIPQAEAVARWLEAQSAVSRDAVARTMRGLVRKS